MNYNIKEGIKTVALVYALMGSISNVGYTGHHSSDLVLGLQQPGILESVVLENLGTTRKGK